MASSPPKTKLEVRRIDTQSFSHSTTFPNGLTETQSQSYSVEHSYEVPASFGASMPGGKFGAAYGGTGPFMPGAAYGAAYGGMGTFMPGGTYGAANGGMGTFMPGKSYKPAYGGTGTHMPGKSYGGNQPITNG